MRRPSPLSFLFCLALLGIPAAVCAEPVVVTAEGSAALALSAPQTDRFGSGGSVAVGALYSLFPKVQIGIRARALALLDRTSEEAVGVEQPKMGMLEGLSLALRYRPLAKDGERRAKGLFVEVAGGGGLTGDLLRPSLGGAVGYGVELGTFVMAPALRYTQIIQPPGGLSGDDARLLLLGLEFAMGDRTPTIEPLVQMAPEPEPLPDSDGDGVPDEDDLCDDEPEDIDGFEDANGCPDPDNDGDKILDKDDSCPDVAEDVDNFADDDGCPDPDNDDDGFLDADDSCPNEAEVINGNKDFDGCPDRGLITMVDDRIVLEELVLFDLERARIKRAGRPVLRAIVNLVSQHPEWLKIRIEGHADARGDKEYNQNLSQRRADNVRDELIKLGLPPEPIESVGYGATMPRDKRDSPDAYKRNRRVEFVVLARRTGGVAREEAPQELGDRGGLGDVPKQAQESEEAQESGESDDSEEPEEPDEPDEPDEPETAPALPAPVQTTKPKGEAKP